MAKDKETSDKSMAPKDAKMEKTQSDSTKKSVEKAENQSKDKAIEKEVNKAEAKEPVKKPPPEKAKTEKAVAIARPGTQSAPLNKPTILIAGLGLVVAGAAVLGVFYNYSQWQNMASKERALLDEQVQLASALNDVRTQVGELNRLNNDVKLQIESTKQSIERNRDRQAAMQVSLEHVEELTLQKGHIPLFWKYAEVEYLLTIANHRLILERDFDTAKLALSDADARLKAIGDPALIPIRGKIADEISALKSVDRPDLPGMSARLRSLVENIEQLPLISKDHLLTITTQDQKDREIDSWTELPGTIWQDIKSLVEIKRTDGGIEPLLPPDEKHYLAQNLGLKLEEARIALLNRDTPVFRQNLSDTRVWIERYFDKESPAVTNVINTVNELESVELKPKLPDISGSLRQLRDWIAQFKNRESASLGLKHKPKVAWNNELLRQRSRENLSQ